MPSPQSLSEPDRRTVALWAANCAGRVLDLFEDIIDIVDSGFVPKERAEAYHKLLASHAVEPGQSAMFEDMPHNLEPAHEFGMTTVLVHSSYIDHPIQLKIWQWTEAPEHIHHMTEDLRAFLAEADRAGARPAAVRVVTEANMSARTREALVRLHLDARTHAEGTRSGGQGTPTGAPSAQNAPPPQNASPQNGAAPHPKSTPSNVA